MRSMFCCLITRCLEKAADEHIESVGKTITDEYIESVLFGSPLNRRKKFKDNQILMLNDKLAEVTNEVFKRLPGSSFRINWREPGKRYMIEED